MIENTGAGEWNRTTDLRFTKTNGQGDAHIPKTRLLHHWNANSSATVSPPATLR